MTNLILELFAVCRNVSETASLTIMLFLHVEIMSLGPSNRDYSGFGHAIGEKVTNHLALW
jgi:hypothetical protein